MPERPGVRRWPRPAAGPATQPMPGLHDRVPDPDQFGERASRISAGTSRSRSARRVDDLADQPSSSAVGSRVSGRRPAIAELEAGGRPDLLDA